MLLTKEVTVNLGYRENLTVLDAMQGDSGRALNIHFVSGETAWQLPEDIQVVLQYGCEDSTGGTYDSLPGGAPAYTVSGENSLTVALIPQLFAVAGITKLQITLLSGGTQISTFPVTIRVSPGVTGEASGGEYVNLQKWLLEAVRQDAFVAAVLGVIPDGDEVSY